MSKKQNTPKQLYKKLGATLDATLEAVGRKGGFTNSREASTMVDAIYAYKALKNELDA